MEQIDEDLAFALETIDRVDRETMARFGAKDLRVALKADHTPVSDADRAAERLIREAITLQRPTDAVYGEEEGGSLAHSARRWIIDPIDATKNYVRGVPVWATLLGLEQAGEIVLGVVSAPALGRRWWAARGRGAYAGGAMVPTHQIHVSRTASLDEASFSYSSLTGWEERGALTSFLGLADACWRTRAFGDFWSYMLVAEGTVDCAAEPELEIYDMAALVPIVEEAGGRFTALDGIRGPWGGNAVASNGVLHDEVLRILNGR
ncbi:MAG: histidinol-phosphatase [Ancrocorticia sp.]|jgi:histidinol-phosphatase|nr:histidinol-phosphatase [Ancrocorticia sp.]MCI1932347.1 histidinol-phosphatase [Ancrocorticia sp.]MCI1962808.1 histidinol-phosphatase [Ancrocorticia sp.]MCI2001912.1 histidinol-phosphatase [Ancrocorticia sp.]MCI2012449.1 histidinol-phosphatase [Ancrocorticia sp.]